MYTHTNICKNKPENQVLLLFCVALHMYLHVGVIITCIYRTGSQRITLEVT